MTQLRQPALIKKLLC